MKPGQGDRGVRHVVVPVGWNIPLVQERGAAVPGRRKEARHPVSVVAAALLGAALVVVPAAPAQAHTKLTGTNPAAKSTVTKPVTAVTLTFSGLVKETGTKVEVTGPDDVSYSDGAAHVVDKTVTQAVKPLPVGAIRVAWRTVASDGDPIEGNFTFTNAVGPPTPTAARTPTAVATPAADPTVTAAAPTPPASVPVAGTDPDDGASVGVGWAAGAGAAAVLAVLGGLLWWRRRPTGRN